MSTFARYPPPVGPARVLGVLCVLLGCVLAPVSLAAQKAGRRPEVVAHRGASFDAPENTMAAVNLAWEQKADAVEVDVYLTKDQRVVCFHDKELSRTTTAVGYVHEKSLAELQALDAGSWKNPKWAGEPIPAIEPVLASIPVGKRLLIEIKCGPEIVPHLVRAVEESGKPADQIAFISFKADSCEAIKRALPAHRVYLLSGFDKAEDGTTSPTLDFLRDRAVGLGLDGLDLSHTGPHTTETCRAIRSAGLFLAAWTVNEPARARELTDMGFQSITTDKPAVMRAAFGD